MCLESVEHHLLQTAHLVMELAVDGLAILVHQFERVGAIPIHVRVAIWDPAIGEQERDLVSGLGTQGDEVPEHICILNYQWTSQ